MDEKSIENLRNWLRERRNKQLDRAYKDARRYLGGLPCHKISCAMRLSR